jgi:hypothetical protein
MRGNGFDFQVGFGSEHSVDSIGSYWFYCNASNAFVQKCPLCTTDLSHVTDFRTNFPAAHRGGFQSYPPSSCLPFLRITALAGCVLRFSLGLPPSSPCVLRIEGNDRPETRCRTEGTDSRPVSLPEFLQPARLALSFSATSIQQSHRGTDQQPDQSRLVMDQERFSPPGTRRLRREPNQRLAPSLRVCGIERIARS